MGCTYYGRRKIFAVDDNINEKTVWGILSNALNVHNTNAKDIDYLYNYYKGKQDIIYRTKTIRSDICNKITINRANEIVSFKRGYLLTENIQYIRKDDIGKEQTKSITDLNGYMESEGKATKDSVLAEWMYICGTGYRIAFAKDWVNPDSKQVHEEGDAPFEMYTLDPRECFVAYSREIGNKPVFACVCSKHIDDMSTLNITNEYTVYTADKIYKLKNSNVVKVSENELGMIPIVEYPENNSRLGAFEIVLPILDSINNVISNSIDDLEQVVQSLLVLVGVDVKAKDADGNDISTIEAIREEGGIAIPEGADAKYLSLQLNGGQTQTIINNLDQEWLEICGMPNRNGGMSTSDTGAAVQLRDGWSAAETMAMNTQTMWTESERDFLKIIFAIMKAASIPLDMKVTDIIPHFNRQNAINIQSRVQAFTGLVAAGLAEKDCVKISGIAFDVETVVENWKKAKEEQEKKQAEQMKNVLAIEDKKNQNQDDNQPVKDNDNAGTEKKS